MFGAVRGGVPPLTQALMDRPPLGPLIQGAIKLMGSDPSSVFSDMNTIAGPALNGTRFSWTPTSESSGELVVHHAAPTLDVVFTAWEGTLSYAWDVLGVNGAIDPHVMLPDRSSARLPIRWSARPS